VLPTPIVTDGSTERVTHAPKVVLPTGAQAFVERAARLEQLARNHPLGAYLALIGRVCRAQADVYPARAAPELTEAARAASVAYGMPPLAAQSHERDPQWRDDLAEIAKKLRPQANDELRATLDAIPLSDTTALDALAERVLTGNALDQDAALVPLIGAALQVYFSRRAAALSVADVGNCDVATICPVCATRPVGSVVRLGGAQANLRYLVCALCGTEWNMVRVKCSSCEQDKGVHYLSIEQDGRKSADAPVRAEVCDECKSYLKIFYQEKDPLLEATADDLATLALDLLVDEQGYQRSGPNFLLHPGSG
jgi:FdhE protein